MTESELMADFYGHFVSVVRNDGTKFYHLRSDTPRQYMEIVHAAHDGMLPDDYVYETLYFLAGKFDDVLPDDWDDQAPDLCDSLVDVYNTDLLRWLASHLYRAQFVDEAVQDYGFDPGDFSLFKLLALGQYSEIRQIADYLISGIRNLADDDESED